jgi:hypothetical protein
MCLDALRVVAKPASSCQQDSQDSMVWAYSMACFAPRRQVLEMRARVPACGFHEAYSSRAIRTHLSRQGIRAVVHKRLIRSPHANAVADPVAGRWPSLVRERNKTTPNTAHQAVPEPRGTSAGASPAGVPHLSLAVTRVSPKPSTHLDHKAPFCANGGCPDLDHVDVKSHFRQSGPWSAASPLTQRTKIRTRRGTTRFHSGRFCPFPQVGSE